MQSTFAVNTRLLEEGDLGRSRVSERVVRGNRYGVSTVQFRVLLRLLAFVGLQS